MKTAVGSVAGFLHASPLTQKESLPLFFSFFSPSNQFLGLKCCRIVLVGGVGGGVGGAVASCHIVSMRVCFLQECV